MKYLLGTLPERAISGPRAMRLLGLSGQMCQSTTGSASEDSDELVFADEDESDNHAAPDNQIPWRILIVDDDADVHQSTLFSLGGETVLGRPLHFHHAYSRAEGIEVLSKCPGIALVLLDVVMETPEAGFELARHIREEIANSDIRIIIRTGQPAMLSESDATNVKDINRFILKSQLTHSMLLDVVTSEIQQFQDLTS
ncbi:MAG: hypothetical protein JJ959_07155 [Nisaea sp.]|uniref:response regulator n=1 Tax=Nisaea sp. TaxID=2024842 RepID=UPI001B0454C8|nr:hypothetical protein [Nisaea sp.]MBO6560297.1 hypothetical protein [Nisaea sp.]